MTIKTEQSPLILLAAGGTGGHIFPAEALARALLARNLRVAFVTDGRGTKFSGDLAAAVPVHAIATAPLSPKGIFKLALGFLQSCRLLHRLKPAAIVGFGGYVSVPPLAAAWTRGCPILIHDQNAVLGRANALFAPVAARVATSFATVSGLKAKDKIRYTGNPIRPAFVPIRALPYQPPDADGPIRLFVLGGSLGAQIFSTVIPEALALLPEKLRGRLQIAQQCRTQDRATADAAYAKLPDLSPDLAPFFTDVPDRIATAHLVISRAGGSTVAELCVAGRPALFVPYPHALADEQTANALNVVDTGGGWIVPQAELTAQRLAQLLQSILENPDRLAYAAAASAKLGKADAAERLADCVQDVLHR
jgi:UDP-N-acetylglucosamine--N-acetylmuramyl-(pentapeptide) pyrophosphoryl-undecaprenol N-acetylglucosamine transferase